MRLMNVFTFAFALGLGGGVGAEQPVRAGEQELHTIMQQGAEDMQSMPMTGDLEHDFVWAMKKHDQSAIDMAQVLLEHSKDARARQFAQAIIERHKREIREFDQWMAKHHQPMK
jgi:uncharacterized protein (DUF305 family)